MLTPRPMPRPPAGLGSCGFSHNWKWGNLLMRTAPFRWLCYRQFHVHQECRRRRATVGTRRTKDVILTDWIWCSHWTLGRCASIFNNKNKKRENKIVNQSKELISLITWMSSDKFQIVSLPCHFLTQSAKGWLVKMLPSSSKNLLFCLLLQALWTPSKQRFVILINVERWDFIHWKWVNHRWHCGECHINGKYRHYRPRRRRFRWFPVVRRYP